MVAIKQTESCLLIESCHLFLYETFIKAVGLAAVILLNVFQYIF